ncbi:uncharacterized protein LOC143026122 [Oratosquilla oratoria]|uniref:uncharacterized protein LOC143026122 n=1 Tax=Oratosquilla oratoria TaxID=337810 RepID=UPI003F77740A
MNKNCLNDIEFTSEDIIEAISELKPISAAGPDNLPAVFLKKCKKVIATLMSIIWRKSLEEGAIPSTLKEGLITPIFKGGSRGMVSNCRPVCLTSHIIKVFERVVWKSIVNFLESTGQFNPGQHGFCNGRSWLSQLLDHYANVLEKVACGKRVVWKSIVNFLERTGQFNLGQHGFCNGRSCLSQLLDHYADSPPPPRSSTL